MFNVLYNIVHIYNNCACNLSIKIVQVIVAVKPYHKHNIYNTKTEIPSKIKLN